MVPSIRRRLLILLLPAVLGLWLLSAVITYFDTRIEVEKLLDTQLASSGRVLLALTLHEVLEQRLLGGGDAPQGETIPQDFWQLGHPYEKKMVFQVWINQNVVALRSENAPLKKLSNIDTGFSNILLNNEEWRIFSVQTEDAMLRVQIGELTEIRHNLANAVVWRTLVPLLLSLPFLAMIIWVGIGRGMSPLQTIASEMRIRRPSNLQPIDDTVVPNEAKDLTKSLNLLFSHMKAAFDTERRFTSDAAHELRTPLAALKTHAEVALKAIDADEKQQALRQVVRGVDRSTRLVEQLLTLARLDPDSGVKDIRRFDLFIVAETVIGDEVPIALDKNIEISLAGTRGKFVKGSSDAISVLLRNLVDNAIRYTPENGTVEVNIQRDDDSIILSVSDSGPGIPEAERELVFKRFYRQLGNKSPGSGLGLSIVTRIAELHNLDIKLNEANLGGLQVDVIFPASDAEES
ncbi:MAG: ATP-binding protein [Gammaproteobacteria bacterium]|nr:ATP-binding protein [Gammaproteobacteria bacterium]MDH5730934.1 ATP-binding protein [Gammaproteobacteria bacterium]